MAHEYLSADVHGLYVIAELHHSFWTNPTPQAAAELRLQLVGWGLSPIDRRRLEWRIDRDEPGAARPIAAQVPPADADDPRRVLQMPTKAAT